MIKAPLFSILISLFICGQIFSMHNDMNGERLRWNKYAYDETAKCPLCDKRSLSKNADTKFHDIIIDAIYHLKDTHQATVDVFLDTKSYHRYLEWTIPFTVANVGQGVMTSSAQ